MVFDIAMRKIILAAAATLAAVGVALAQVEASSSTYFLDIDPARYAGPPGQRIAVVLGDQPRHIALNAQDEICVQLQSAPTDHSVISARVRSLKPEQHAAAVVTLAGPGVSPGTFRSTPWGMLMRVVPEKAVSLNVIKPVGTSDAPVCTL
jgi:hypothetical protein